MYLWRLSASYYAERFDGGYGLSNQGRWNARGRAVTYCATGPALCLLERLVHIEDASQLPGDTMLVQYDVPDDIVPDTWPVERLPAAMAVRCTGDTSARQRLAGQPVGTPGNVPDARRGA